ncbi:hypothetical protein ACHAWF_018740 [Thalassiosira exigua]
MDARGTGSRPQEPGTRTTRAGAAPSSPSNSLDRNRRNNSPGKRSDDNPHAFIMGGGSYFRKKGARSKIKEYKKKTWLCRRAKDADQIQDEVENAAATGVPADKFEYDDDLPGRGRSVLLRQNGEALRGREGAGGSQEEPALQAEVQGVEGGEVHAGNGRDGRGDDEGEVAAGARGDGRQVVAHRGSWATMQSASVARSWVTLLSLWTGKCWHIIFYGERSGFHL